MRTSETIGAISEAMVKFQAEVQNPPNTADNPFFKSKYAPLSDILNRMRPLLSKHGLVVVQSAAGDGETISIQTMLAHKSGEWIEACPLVLPLDKPTPQGCGSAITYGRRYALSAILNIASEDDDDANATEPEKPKAKKPATTITQTAVYKKMMALTNEVFADYSVEERLRLMHEHIEAAYGLTTSKDLNAEQISQIIEWLEGWREPGEELP